MNPTLSRMLIQPNPTLIVRVIYIFLFGSVNLKVLPPRTRNQTDSVRFQKNEPNTTQNANSTQPNSYSSGWVSPTCSVECTPLLKIRKDTREHLLYSSFFSTYIHIVLRKSVISRKLSKTFRYNVLRSLLILLNFSYHN